MGSLAKNVRNVRGLRLGVLCITALALFPGCDTKTDKGTISSASFSAAQLVNGGVSALSDKLELLHSILPGERLAALEELPAEARPFGKLAATLLGLYETRNGAVCSVNIGGGVLPGESRIKMHFDRIGLEEELAAAGAVQPVISDDVPAITIAGGVADGWTIAFEPQSRSVVAFRSDPDYRPEPAGDPDHENFGRGNGMILSLVLDGLEMQRELQTESIPRITRMHSLGGGRILLFFQEVFREIHVLNLNVEQEQVDFDLSDGNDPASIRLTPMLRGTLRGGNEGPGDRPAPLLTFDDILDVTQGLFLDIDGMQPIGLDDGSALIFDAIQSMLMRIFLTVNGASLSASIEVAATPRALLNALLAASGPFEIAHAWVPSSGNEIMLLEESTNSIIGYNPSTGDPNQSLRSVINSVNLVSNRRDPTSGGGIIPGVGQEPILQPAVNDLGGVGQRLLFDQGRDELISVTYLNGVVVIVGKRDAFSFVTRESLVDLTYLESMGGGPDGSQLVRAWDTESSSLLNVMVDFVVLPDVAQ